MITTTTTTAPRSIEDMIAGYWRELLDVEVVRPDDDFIGLGGDSMRATLLANRIEDELGVRPEIAELFTTLALVARHCEDLLGGDPRSEGGDSSAGGVGGNEHRAIDPRLARGGA
jgi:acyl carrier protein